MKKKLLLLLLIPLLSLNLSFANPVMDFILSNSNAVFSLIITIIFFSLILGASEIWTSNSGEATGIALGISLIIGLLVFFIPDLSNTLLSIMENWLIYVITFLIISSLIIFFYSKDKKGTRAISLIVLIATIAGLLIYYFMNNEASSPGQEGGINTGTTVAIIAIIIGAIALIIFLIYKFKDNSIAQSSTLSKSTNPVKKKLKGESIIKGKVLEFEIGKKPKPINKIKVKITNGTNSFEDETDKKGQFKIIIPANKQLNNAYLEIQREMNKFNHKMIFSKPPNNKRENFQIKPNMLYPNITIPILKGDIQKNTFEQSYKDFEEYVLTYINNYFDYLEELDEFLLNCIKLRIKNAMIYNNGTNDCGIFGASFSNSGDLLNNNYWKKFLENITNIFNKLDESEKKFFLKYFWHMALLMHNLNYGYSFKDITTADEYRKKLKIMKTDYSALKSILGGII